MQFAGNFRRGTKLVVKGSTDPHATQLVGGFEEQGRLHDRDYPALPGRGHHSTLARRWNGRVCHPGVPEWRAQRRVRISHYNLESGTPIKAENSPKSE